MWYVGENVKTLHGVYENEKELNEYKERIQKQEERGKFLTHAHKKDKRHHGVVKGPEE